MPEENFKNGKDYLDPRLDNYLRELDIRLGGKREGRNEEKVEIAMNMINENFGYEVISKITGLSISEIEEIAKNIKDKN